MTQKCWVKPPHIKIFHQFGDRAECVLTDTFCFCRSTNNQRLKLILSFHRVEAADGKSTVRLRNQCFAFNRYTNNTDLTTSSEYVINTTQ